MRSDNIKICSRADVSPAMQDLCRSSKHACSGTFHKTDDGREAPCIGGGLLVTEYYETETAGLAEGDFMDALAGIISGAAAERTAQIAQGAGSIKIAHIVNTAPCPCERRQAEEVEQDTLKTQLSVEKIWTPTEKQLAGLRAFRDEHKSLYIYGRPDTGKTYLAYLCAKAYAGRKTIFLNTKLSEFFRKNSHELQPADFKGLVICDDIQENLPTPFFQSALFEALDLVKRRRLRMIIVANLTPEEFVERYAVEELRKPQFENRLSKMEIIKL